MTYNIEDLELKDDSVEEQERTRQIFEDLKSKAINGEFLSEYEKEFFSTGVLLSILDDGELEDYSCCENYKFKIIYLVYFHDLSGFGTYQKLKGTSYYIPGRKEISKDLEFLKEIEIKWQNTINKTNHDNELLQQISKETRKDLKEIEKQKGRLYFRKDKLRYNLAKSSTLLQSKYIYCMSLQVFEMFDKKEFILSLNGEEIEINEYSIIHILNRHYSQITKYNSKKSFHTKEFEPRYLNKQIGEIFKDIDASGCLIGKSINKIAFKYKHVDYLIWVQKKTKQIKGKGSVTYNRLETFYPVTDMKELKQLKEMYNPVQINKDLSVYVKKE